MKTLRILWVLGMLIPWLRAEEDATPDPSLFSQPGAFVHLSGLEWSCKGKVIENRQRQTKPMEREWLFRSGCGGSVEGGRSQHILWHFIKSTEYGDIYVITFEDKDHGMIEVPIIYDGKKPLILNHYGMRFEISESETPSQPES